VTIDDAINAMADAIAYAEGFYVTGSRPQRDNNPGDMTKDLIGRAVGMDGAFVVYANAQDGWDNLKQQISLIFNDASQIYNSDMTIYQIAQKYTTTDQLAWAQNVASRLGVSLDTKISDLVSGIEQVVTSAPVIDATAGIILIVVMLYFFHSKNK